MNAFIKIRKIKKSKEDYEILVNDEKIHNVSVVKADPRLYKYVITSTNEESSKFLSSINIQAFWSAGVGKIIFKEWIRLGNFNLTVYIDKPGIGVIFIPDLINWNTFFSPITYNAEFSKIFLKYFPEVINTTPRNYEFIYKKERFGLVSVDPLEITIFNPVLFTQHIIIKEVIDTELEKFFSTHIETLENLGKDQKVFLFTSFSFPDELKVSCEQYLLYFAQFLQDLGITANSNLKEEAGRVLFSVTPTDDVEALDKIREALAVYLKLPESPIVYDDSFAAMRLQQQIENLQHSQKMAVREIQVNEKLLLAQSDMIREKNLTISHQQTVIENQNKIIEKILSKSIMMDSAENKEELEEIYDGIKVGESKFLKEQIGIHLNPAKAIKTAVKNTFGKDEKNSILGLNEED